VAFSDEVLCLLKGKAATGGGDEPTYAVAADEPLAVHGVGLVANDWKNESCGGKAIQKPFALLLHPLTQASGEVFGPEFNVASGAFGQAFDFALRTVAHFLSSKGLGFSESQTLTTAFHTPFSYLASNVYFLSPPARFSLSIEPLNSSRVRLNSA
jgi:hypothetical protein